MQKFEVVFSGQIAPGADVQQVRQGIQRLFNASEAVLEQFFSGRRIVVKRELDAAAAEKYRQAFAQVGALVEVLASGQPLSGGVDAPAVTEASGPAVSDGLAGAVAEQEPAEEQKSGILQVAPRDEYMAAFAHVQAPDFGLAKTGADLQDSKPEEKVPELDLSALTLAPAGSDLEQLPGAEPVTPPDISHLRLEP